jgi:hypothetical protein
MSLTTTEQLAHMLAADGHRVTYELQVDSSGAPVGERLWHYEGVCPKCVSVKISHQNHSKCLQTQT